MTPRCPVCDQPLPIGKLGVSKRAAAEYFYMRREAPKRGGFMYEGARPAFERGEYEDRELEELLAAGLIALHPNPKKGFVVTNKEN